MKDKVKQLLEKQQYRFAGRHTAVKICTWTKNSIRNKGVCYKERFYGISSHRCVQMSPSIGFCHNRCIFCWRPIEYTEGTVMTATDKPKEIIEKCIEQQKVLLTGFGGNDNADKKKLAEADKPKHFAISLSGEPTLYPKLNSLIKELHKQGYSTFVVTNGMEPGKLAGLEPPTQLYLSVDAPNKELFLKIDQPAVDDAWQRLMDSLDTVRRLGTKTRTCLRLTMIKGLNMVHPEEWAELIAMAKPWFVEVKAYMFVGFSKKRMKRENMPLHSDIKAFSKKIAEHSGYRIADQEPRSRVVLLVRDDIKNSKIQWG